MRNAFKSIRRMKLMAFLIVLQLSISLIMVNSTTSIIEGYTRKIDGFSRLMGKEKMYLLRVIDPNSAERAEKEKKENKPNLFRIQKLYYIKEFNIGLEDLKGEGIIKNIFYNYPIGSTFVDPKNLNEEYKNKYEEAKNKNQVVFGNSSSIIVNYDFINHYNLSLYEGRTFNKEDFNIDYRKEPIPIILGKGYNEKLKLGDILETQVREYDCLLKEPNADNIQNYTDDTGELSTTEINLKLKVIGFYNDNAIPVMVTKSDFIENVQFSNTFSIIPCVKGIPILNEIIINNDLGTYIEIENEADLQEIKNKLEPNFKSKGLEIRVTDLGEEHEKVMEVMLRDVLNTGLLGAVLMLLSVIGITSVLLGEINERKKEFGIRIAFGAELKTLCKEMIMEIGLMIGMASIISIIAVFIKQIGLKEELAISINVILTNISIMGIIVILISILPIIRLRKMNPVELVRGE